MYKVRSESLQQRNLSEHLNETIAVKYSQLTSLSSEKVLLSFLSETQTAVASMHSQYDGITTLNSLKTVTRKTRKSGSCDALQLEAVLRSRQSFLVLITRTTMHQIQPFRECISAVGEHLLVFWPNLYCAYAETGKLISELPVKIPTLKLDSSTAIS